MFSFFFFRFFFLCVYPVLNHFLCSNWMASLDAFCAQQSTRTLAFNNSCRLHSSICMHQEVKRRHMWPICFGPSGTVLFDEGILITPLHSGCNRCVSLAGHFTDAAALHWQFFSSKVPTFVSSKASFHACCLGCWHPVSVLSCSILVGSFDAVGRKFEPEMVIYFSRAGRSKGVTCLEACRTHFVWGSLTCFCRVGATWYTSR